MENVLAIFKKEFKSFFISPIAYVFITVYLVVTNFLFFQGFFIINQADMRGYFGLLPWIFLFFVPAITMRSWAEEKKVRTLELLQTWPVSDIQVVARKISGIISVSLQLQFFFHLQFQLRSLCLVHLIQVRLSADISVHFLWVQHILQSDLWISSHTENQIVAFILGVVATFILFIIGNQFVTLMAPPASSAGPELIWDLAIILKVSNGV